MERESLVMNGLQQDAFLVVVIFANDIKADNEYSAMQL